MTILSLLIITVVLISASLVFDPIFFVFFQCVGVFLISLSTRNRSVIARYLVLTALFLVPLSVIHGLLNKQFMMDSYFLGVGFSASGFDYAISLGSKISGFILLATAALTFDKEYIVRLVFSLRGPIILTIIVSQIISLTSEMQLQVAATLDAQRARGVKLDSSPWSFVRKTIIVLVPVAVRLLVEAEQRSQMLASRGVGSFKPLAEPVDLMKYRDLLLLLMFVLNFLVTRFLADVL